MKEIRVTTCTSIHIKFSLEIGLLLASDCQLTMTMVCYLRARAWGFRVWGLDFNLGFRAVRHKTLLWQEQLISLSFTKHQHAQYKLILAEGARALSVTLSGGALFAS